MILNNLISLILGAAIIVYIVGFFRDIVNGEKSRQRKEYYDWRCIMDVICLQITLIYSFPLFRSHLFSEDFCGVYSFAREYP